MTDPTSTIMTISVKVKRGRLNSMMQQCYGEMKRASRRDRAMILHRWLKRIQEKCIKVAL